MASRRHKNAEPKAPSTLGTAGRACWDECWGLEWIEPSDRGSVAHLCALVDEQEKLNEAVTADGVTLTKVLVSPRGDVVGDEKYSHPALAQLRKIDPTIVRLRAALGLDPISRAKLGIEPEREPDAIDRIVNDRRERLHGRGLLAIAEPPPRRAPVRARARQNGHIEPAPEPAQLVQHADPSEWMG